MKRFIRFLSVITVIIIAVVSCTKGPVKEPAIIQPFIAENYIHDAKLLYMNEVHRDSTHRAYNDTDIDETEVLKVLDIIRSIYNCASPVRDTVFDVLNIHAQCCIAFNFIQLRVQPSLPEYVNLANNVIPTGNNDLDQILVHYGFDTVDLAYSYPSFPWLSIIAKNKEYNLLPIAKRLEQIPSIEYAEFPSAAGHCIGDGDNILLKRTSNFAVVTFKVGWGDCPAGCTGGRAWEFIVENGSARFTRSYGSPITDDYLRYRNKQ